FVTAFSPLLFNLALIAVMIVLMIAREDAGFAALALAATVGIAGLLQLLVLALRRSEAIATPLRISFNAEMRGFFARAVPGMVASAGPQLLAIAGAVIASSSPSAVSWLYFANRLIELPLGMVGVAIGTVLIPELTRALHGDDKNAIVHAESRALELVAGLALPAMLGLIVLSAPIVQLLFEHGAYTAADSAWTAQALIWLALGLPAHVLTKALSPAFFARGDTWTPLLATLKGFVFAIALALLLGHFLGVAGIAMGLAFGAWSTASSLIRQGATSFGLSLDIDARRRLPRIVVASLLMGGPLWLASGITANSHGLAQAAILLALIAGGIVIYGLLLLGFRVITRDEVINALTRREHRDLHM